MKVLLVNGSPHPNGCTYTALSEVASALNSEGIETEIFQLGKDPIRGCMACGGCHRSGNCVFDDPVNAFAKLAKDADGFIFGSPVHYAAADGSLTSFMSRLFYSHGSEFMYKPAAAVVSCRRSGSTAALDQINKYFPISGMPIVPSQYWNMVHGNTPEQVRQDLEGLQIMRTLGRNMAYMLKCIEAGRNAGIQPPVPEKRQSTNFIR
ncbi:MAG: flavodoxin family protein [Clostridia bacterium]|nr:flavodoxin family protein [Clostridia bacterium]